MLLLFKAALANLILDQMLGAAGAYSLRKIRGTYSGPAIRVRRSTDDAEADIGFDGNGELNIAALLAFVGAGSGFVPIWYDQSGNARHFTQSTSGNQPRIVNSGVVDTKNNKPALVFDGTDDRLLGNAAATNMIAGAGGVTILGVAAPGATAANRTLMMLTAPASLSTAIVTTGYSATNRFRNVTRRVEGDTANITQDASNGAFTSDALILHGTVANYTGTASITVYKDGVSRFSNGTNMTTGTVSGLGSLATSIGGNSDNSAYFSGSIAEVILFPTALSNTDRQTVEANQKAYYATA